MNVARTCHVLRANPSGTPFDSTVLTECIVIEKIPWTTVCKLYERSWWNKILFYTWQILTYTNKWNMIYVAISFIYNIWTYTNVNVNVNVRKIHVRIKPFQFMNISPCTYVDMWSFFFWHIKIYCAVLLRRHLLRYKFLLTILGSDRILQSYIFTSFNP